MFGDKFRDFISKNFDTDTAKGIDEKMQYEEWVLGPGLPPVQMDFTTVLLNESSAMADGYISLDGSASPSNYADFYDFYSSLKVVFIERLNARFSDVDIATIEKIDGDYNLTNTVDPECKQRWFPLGIKKGYEPVYPQAHTFISTQGRLKYLTPIYQALLDAGQKDMADAWYEENKNFYHPMASAKIAKMLGLSEIQEEVLFMQ